MIISYDDSLKDIAIELGHRMYLESRFREFRYSGEKIIKVLKNPDVFCRIAFEENKPIAFFLGVIQQMWFSDQKAGYDLALYVVPEKRGGMIAVRLIREFEKFCKENGCVTINLGSGAEISTNTARRLYTRLGYKECGFLSHKEI